MQTWKMTCKTVPCCVCDLIESWCWLWTTGNQCLGRKPWCCWNILFIVPITRLIIVTVHQSYCIQNDHLSRKSVREFDNCQENVRSLTKSQGSVWEKVLSGKTIYSKWLKTIYSKCLVLWCLSGGKRGDYQNCSVLYCVLKLCTVISTLTWTVLTLLWIGFCHTGPISLCVDLFVFIYVYFVFLFDTA